MTVVPESRATSLEKSDYYTKHTLLKEVVIVYRLCVVCKGAVCLVQSSDHNSSTALARSVITGGLKPGLQVPSV